MCMCAHNNGKKRLGVSSFFAVFESAAMQVVNMESGGKVLYYLDPQRIHPCDFFTPELL